MSIQPYIANNQPLTTQKFKEAKPIPEFVRFQITQDGALNVRVHVATIIFTRTISGAIVGALLGGAFHLLSQPTALYNYFFSQAVEEAIFTGIEKSVVMGSVALATSGAVSGVFETYSMWSAPFINMTNNKKAKFEAELEKSQSVIENFLDHRKFIDGNAAKDVQCSISMELMLKPTSTPCNHTFNYDHIIKHLNIRETCPNCQGHLEQKQLKYCFLTAQRVTIVLSEIQKVLNENQVERIPNALRDRGLQQIKRDVNKVCQLMDLNNASIKYATVTSCSYFLKNGDITPDEHVKSTLEIVEWYNEIKL